MRRRGWSSGGVLAIVIAITVIATGCDFSQIMLIEDPANLVEIGDQALWQSRFAAAEDAYTGAISADPKSSVAYAHRCYLRTFQQRFDEAIADCQQAIALAAEQAEGYIYLTRAYDWAGEFEKAIEAGERAITLAAEDGLAHSFLGEAYVDAGRLEEGEAALRLGVELAPEVAETHRNLAYFYGIQAQTEAQLAELETAVWLAPEFAFYRRALADKYLRLEQYERALAHYEMLLVILQSSDGGRDSDPLDDALVLSNMGYASSKLSTYAEAIEYYTQALAILRSKMQHRFGEATVLYNIAQAYLEQAMFEEALKFYQEALLIWPEIRSWEGIDGLADTLSGMAWAYSSLSNFEQAVIHGQQVLAIWRGIRVPGAEQEIANELATAENNLGMIYYSFSHYEAALAHLEVALDLLQEQQNSTTIAAVQLHIGVIKFALARYSEALDHSQQALSLIRQSNLKSNEARTVEAGALNNIGVTLRKLFRFEEALQYYQEALPILQTLQDRYNLAATLNNIGLIHNRLGQFDQALESYEQALAIRENILDRPGQVLTLNNIALVYVNQGNREEAIVYFKRSVEIIESIQGKIHVEAFQTSFLDEQVDVYTRLITLLHSEGRSAEAFKYSEQARARSFLNQFGNARIDFRRGATPTLVTQERELRQQLHELQGILDRERAKPPTQQNVKELDEISRDLEQSRKEYEGLIAQLQLVSPEYASMVSISTLDVDQIQNQVLDAQTTLIEYFVLREVVLAWVIDRDGLELVTLGISQDELVSQITYLRSLITVRDYDTDMASDLYDTLITPLKAHIHHTNVILVPHGVLHYLPFAALWNRETEQYLVEEYALTYAPSASVLKFILDKRNDNHDRLLALGNPDGTLSEAEREVQAIAQLHDTQPQIGDNATESYFRAHASTQDYLHLAAHGVYDPFNPLFSRVELASEDDEPDGEHDGNLEVHEVYGLDLSEANLVVLSACETALGEQSAGDEIVGLPRAFLYAGAPSVVTTLWTIDSAASSMLMQSFYESLQAGQTVAEALRTAQRNVMAEEQWRSPYYWAAFTLTGDYLGVRTP